MLPLDNRSIADLVKEMPVAEIPEGGIGDDVYLDLERDFHAAMARD